MHKTKMERKENIESIIFRYLSDSASEEESALLLEWLKESRENRITYFTLKKIWLNTRKDGYTENYIDDEWNRLKLRTTLQSKQKENYKKGFSISLGKISVAASILILIGISSFLGIKLRSMSDYQQTIHEISVPMGSRTNITLPDGTSVWLNADSKLTYTSDFGRGSRDVSLTGEGFFDVRQHLSSVFTVNTRDMNIRALGTQFNVKSYSDENTTETVLISGEIEVCVIDENIRSRPVLLSQNQRIIYSREERRVITSHAEEETEEIVREETKKEEREFEVIPKPSLQIAQVSSIDNYTSWKDGRLVFRSETLTDLARKLERFYNVNISFQDESIKELRYTGTLEEVTIEEVLRAIASASDIRYKIDKNNVTFSK